MNLDIEATSVAALVCTITRFERANLEILQCHDHSNPIRPAVT
jgi:hypothetical protein